MSNAAALFSAVLFSLVVVSVGVYLVLVVRLLTRKISLLGFSWARGMAAMWMTPVYGARLPVPWGETCPT